MGGNSIVCGRKYRSEIEEIVTAEQLSIIYIPLDLLLVSLAAKTGEGIKARETCNTWQPGPLAGQDSVQSASFYKQPISSHMLRKDNDTMERGSAMFFDNGQTQASMKQLTTTPSLLKLEARLDCS